MLTRFIRQRKALIVILLITTTAIPAFSQSDGIITSIQITGLKRTKPRVAEEPLRQFIGQEAASLDIDKVKAAVIDQGILEPLSVTVENEGEGSGQILVVAVKEKWSIFVGPYIFTGSSGTSVGLFFYDANVFGMNHDTIVGGMFGKAGWSATITYTIPTDSPGHFGWSANTAFSQLEQQNTDANNKTLRRYNTRSITAALSPQYRINNDLSALLHVSYTNTMLRDAENPIREPDSGAQFIQLGPELSFRVTSWDGYLLSEESASVKYLFIQDLASPLWHSVSFKGIYEKSIIPGFRASVRSGGVFRPDAPPLLESAPGEAEITILPESFSARYYAGLSLGLEKYLFRFPFATISLYGAGQIAYSSGPIMGDRFDYGVAGSLRFYLTGLAVPAISTGATYNIQANYFQFYFSIGMTL